MSIASESGAQCCDCDDAGKSGRRGIKRWCASDVCLSCTSGLRREQRGLWKRKLAQL